MKRILLDVNVVLDALLDRRGRMPTLHLPSGAPWKRQTRAEAGRLPAHAVTTLHNLNARASGSRMAGDATEALLSVFGVAPVDESVLRAALALGWSLQLFVPVWTNTRRVGVASSSVTAFTMRKRPSVPTS